MQQSITTSPKPILVDALHINMGGALMILDHLIDRLVVLNVNFVLLKDVRCPKLRSENSILKVVVMSSDERVRRRYYKNHYNDFGSVLCLGNIPPAMKMQVPVHTYIHNVSLLKIPRTTSVKRWILNRLKRMYIRHYAGNTDTWIVQTDNTANLVNKYINRKKHPVLILPFYNIPKDIKQTPIEERNDYVFIGEFTGAKGHEYLIEAWGVLAQKGIYPTLHLTTNTQKVIKWIEDVKKSGAKIENHGRVSFDKVVELYNKSKATIYPSLNESLGLGIIEAAEAGCDVIGCDLPYIYSVCTPSEVFIPQNPNAIAAAVVRYEAGCQNRTELHIKDKADELIKLLLQ